MAVLITCSLCNSPLPQPIPSILIKVAACYLQLYKMLLLIRC